jgi:hypothetical protein
LKIQSFGFIIVLLIMVTLSACEKVHKTTNNPVLTPNYETRTAVSTTISETRTPIPYGSYNKIGPDADDDIVLNRWYFYRNSNNIKIANAVLVRGADTLKIQYRDDIQTIAGSYRNNIITVGKEGGLWSNNSTIELYSLDLPKGIGLFTNGSDSIPGYLRTFLVIEVPTNITPGQYGFKIGILLNGSDYGTIPCTLVIYNSSS